MESFIEKIRRQLREEKAAGEYGRGKREGARVIDEMDFLSLKDAAELAEEAQEFYKRHGYVNKSLLTNNLSLGNYFYDTKLCRYKLESSTAKDNEPLTASSLRWFQGWSESILTMWHKGSL